MLVEEFRAGFSDMARLVSLSGDVSSSPDEHMTTLQDIVTTNERSLTETIAVMRQFRDVIVATPRLSVPVNRAKRRAVKVMDDFISELAGALTLLSEIKGEDSATSDS